MGTSQMRQPYPSIVHVFSHSERFERQRGDDEATILWLYVDDDDDGPPNEEDRRRQSIVRLVE